MEVELYCNDHFEDFLYDWKQKYYFLIGGYGSSKSYHVAEKLILKLLEEKRKALVVREVHETHRDSTYSLLCEVIEAMGLGDSIKCLTSPLQIKFPNGSKIIFKGCDKPEKLKSLNGVSIVWLEECSEIKYTAFKELVGRLRHYTKSNHFILSSNPVSKNNWIYKHFFKDERNKTFVLDDTNLYEKRIIVQGDTYYHHSTCDDNHFLPEDYIKGLDDMINYDPDLHRVARRGQFGATGKKVLPQFKTKPHDEVMAKVSMTPRRYLKTGMDFGFETSYNAVVAMAIDHANRDLYIYDVYYSKGKTDPEILPEIQRFKPLLIKADSASPKDIRFYQQNGFKMTGCKKFAGSRLAYTKNVKRFRNIYCSDNCQEVIDELKDLTYATDKLGEIIEDEFSIDPHTLSAIWYGLDDYEVLDFKKFDRNKYGA